MKKFDSKLFYIILLFILSFSMFFMTFYMIEPDYLWHIKAGEYMFRHGILTKDVFSWYLNGHYWMSHEWLFEIIIYFLKSHFGKFHIFIYIFSCIIGLQSILFFSNRKNYMKNTVFSLLWSTLFFMISPFGFSNTVIL